MKQLEIVVALLVVMGFVGALAQKVRIALPILLVVTGVLLSLVTPAEAVRLEPDVVFLIFLPPLLYSEAFNTPWHELKGVLDWVILQALALVVLTVFGVSAAIHAVIPGLPWAAAFVFGAIVSPTDAVAAAAISREVAMPRQVMEIVKGEALTNDATGLVAYKFAVAAVCTGAISYSEIGQEFALLCFGGIIYGLVIGWLLSLVRTKLDHRPVEIISSLISPFFIYLTAERLHVSGVLAVVAGGLMVGFYRPRMYSSQVRLQANANWETISYVLDGFSFLLMGLQFSHVLSAVKTYPLGQILVWTLIAGCAPTLIRLIWSFSFSPIYAKIARKPSPAWSHLLLFSWSGMRGVVSLAAALALPLTCSNGAAFPYRDLIIYLTLVVITSTLLVQGLTLPLLAKRFGNSPDAYDAVEAERKARLYLAREAARRVDEMARQENIDPEDPTFQQVLNQYLEQAMAVIAPGEENVRRIRLQHTLEHEAVIARRRVLVSMRAEHVIREELFDKLQSELDLEEVKLNVNESMHG
jgi:Na+/H+ antiporter